MMVITFENLSLEVQQYIRDKLDEGIYSTPTQVIDSLVRPLIDEPDLTFSGTKNTRGMFVDANISISLEEIEETSREACMNFPREISKE